MVFVKIIRFHSHASVNVQLPSIVINGDRLVARTWPQKM